MAKEGGPVDDPLERFAGLYDQYYRNVLRYALQHADQGSAEDVASEVFLIAWRQLPQLPEPPLPWLLGVARNLLRKQAGAGRRRRMLTDRIAAMTTAGDMLAWDASEHVVERAAALDVLASLPKSDVETLTLVTWHGLSPREAAQVVGCSARAFTVRLHRARRRLGDALQRAEAQQPAVIRRPVRNPAPTRQPSTLIPRK
jgi:RNA polymerase sigma-70 factor (ECF subfamily)